MNTKLNFFALFTVLMIAGMFFVSCEKDVCTTPNSPLFNDDNQCEISDFSELPEDVLNTINDAQAYKSTTYFKSTSHNSEIVRDPGTMYVWYIINYQGSGTPHVKCYTPNHQSVYYPMIYNSSNGIWYLGRTLPMQGHYVWRYVDGNYNNLTTWNTYIDNTYVRFDENGTSSLVWPFGNEDGSSYNNPGLWTMNCGPGCYQHTGNYYYSYDWNWNASDPWSDNGKILESPVDGFVSSISTYTTSYGTAWQIIVEQEYGTKKFRHAFCHIQSSTFVDIGDYVQTGTPIAKLGSTGASSPHAHCQLKLVGNSANIPLEYNAQ